MIFVQGQALPYIIATSTSTLPNIYCGMTSFPAFNLYSNGTIIPTVNQIVNNEGLTGSCPNPAIVWTLTFISGGATLTFSTTNTGNNTTYDNIGSSTLASTPTISVANFYGGTTQYSVKAELYTDITLNNNTVYLLGEYNPLNLICEWPTCNNCTRTQDDYCSFQVAPLSFADPSNGPPYSGATYEFSYGSIADVSDFPMCSGDGYMVWYTIPGNTASNYSYAISQGWQYTYAATPPNTIMLIPPVPVTGPHSAYSSQGELFVTGSGSPSANCVSSYASLPLKVDYPTDTPIHHYIDTTYTPPFINPTNLIISSQTGLYDLKSPGYINLIANLTCDHSNFVTIDWYEADNVGNQTLVAQNTKSITAKVAGNYFAKVNLNQGATVNPTTGARQNYSGSNYYIAQSNVKEVYNSSSTTPNVDSMGVYPNPACGTLHVNYLLSGKVTSANLIITNLSTGAIVLQESLYTTQQTQAVNISSLGNGTYVATIQVNGSSTGSSSQTFVVMCGY
jgi:hypothetical protein